MRAAERTFTMNMLLNYCKQRPCLNLYEVPEKRKKRTPQQVDFVVWRWQRVYV